MRPPDRRTAPGHHTQRRSSPSDSAATTQPMSVLMVARFGRPSTYSLAPRDLAVHIRDLRRQGWQSWEIRARFDTDWRNVA